MSKPAKVAAVRLRTMAAVFDRLYSGEHRTTLERWVVGISIAGFLGHLTHIFLARNLVNPPALISAAGTDYLAAISTPFSFILFYEVLLLISAVPESTTRSIAKQYEIVSLIFVRGFFKDIAALDLEQLSPSIPGVAPAFVKIGAGLIMFLLVTVFQHAASQGPKAQDHTPVSEALLKFIAWKKLLAIGLTAAFLSLAVGSIWEYALAAYGELRRSALSALEPPTTFYSDVFTVMIFTDVLILLLSLLVSDSYGMVFRNAAFVISTILIRLALTAPHPYGAVLGVSGMLFGIVTVLAYNYNSRVKVLTGQ